MMKRAQRICSSAQRLECAVSRVTGSSVVAGEALAALGGVGISIVIPAYNEESNLFSAVERVSSVASELGLEHEILIINDGSSDRTGEIARTQVQPRIPYVRVIEHFPNRGYGGALKAGFAEASKDLIAFIPADNQFDFMELVLLLQSMTDDIMVVSGRRVDRKDNIMRRINAFGWNVVVRILFGRLVSDVDCGFKLFRRELLNRVRLKSDGAMIDTEMLAGARARGYGIREVEVTHFPRTGGSPTGANLRVVLRAFRDLFMFRARLWSEVRRERPGT